MRGSMWLSWFPVRRGTRDRPAGLYGAAFVDYREGGVPAYRELLVARLVRVGAVPRVHVTDIWVDSLVARDGGRSLWAIPKELATLQVRGRAVGPASRVVCDAETDGTAIATAGFTGGRVQLLRTPFRFTLAQEREDGTPVLTAVSGTARTMPVLGRWDFRAGGPLGWLHGRTPVASFHLADLRLTIGC
jgi:hypothetical protein